MATLPTANVNEPTSDPALSAAAAELLDLVEGHFDDIGLSEEEREARYASAREYIDSRNAANKLAASQDAALDAAAAQMAHLIEDYYDEIGLSEQERNQRVAAAGAFISALN